MTPGIVNVTEQMFHKCNHSEEHVQTEPSRSKASWGNTFLVCLARARLGEGWAR